MELRAHIGLTGVAALTLCFEAGCPQMLDDEFALSSREAVSGSGGAGAEATGGSSGTEPNGGTGGGTCVSNGSSSCSGSGTPPDSGTDDTNDAAWGCDGSRGPNGDCYRADSVETTWGEARAGCQALGLGWDLATVRSADENDFVLSISGFEAWIGATDLSDEGIWMWVGDDSLFFQVDGGIAGTPFANWSTGEPNNSDGADCLRMLTTGQWADWPCDSAKGYVCQQRTP